MDYNYCVWDYGLLRELRARNAIVLTEHALKKLEYEELAPEQVIKTVNAGKILKNK